MAPRRARVPLEMRRTSFRLFLFLFLCALLLVAGVATDAMSQQVTGAVHGIVRNAQGIMPGVTVTLTNEGTTVARETITNAVGEYAFLAVPPATYSIRGSLPGYKTYERRGITIGTQERITLDVVLEVGTVETEVTADAPLIETSSASIGDSLDREILETLPAPGRNAFLIAVTIPTVLSVGDPQLTSQQNQSNASRISLGGGGIRANNYLLDGVPITELSGRALLNPTIEAISDVKVQVHTYDAEMGRTGGGVFNTTGRIGTNEFHGSGFFQTRPVWGQSLNYFTAQAGGTKARSGLSDAYYRLYGGGGGGPIVPNRTFFWYAMEGYRSFATRFAQRIWPGLNQRVGDFSQSTISGAPVQIWNPYCRDEVTNARCPATGSGSLATTGLFTGAIIPTGHPALSPAAAAITSFWPTTTISGRAFDGNEDGQPNATDTARTVDQADMFTIKVEHTFTDNWSLSGMYLYNKTDEPAFDYIADKNPRDDFFFNGATWYLERRPHVLVFTNAIILNDTTELTTRYGWTTWLDNTIPGVFPGGPSALGFASSFTDGLDAAGQDLFPGISFAGNIGYRDVGKNSKTLGRRWYSPIAFTIALSKLKGSHTYKVGGDFRRMGIRTPTRFDPAGRFTFDENFTKGPGDVGGHEFASFLLGAVRSGGVDANRGTLDMFTNYMSGYFQDDWRVSSRFTLNWGVRLEKEDGLRERNNEVTVAFDQRVRSPLNDAINVNGVTVEQALGRTIMGGLIFAGVNGAPEEQGDLAALRVSPRLGMTYSLDEATVLRAGWGLFYAPWNYDTSNHGQIGFTRSSSLNQISNDDTGVPITVLDDPFPNGLEAPLGSSTGLLTGTGGQVTFVDQNKGDPTVHQYSIDLQRELAGDMAITVGYTGAYGRDIGFCGSNASCAVNINQVNPATARNAFPLGRGWDPAALRANVANPFEGAVGAGEFADRSTISAAQLLRPFPQFGNVRRLEQTEGGKRVYNALVFKLDKRTGSSVWGGQLSYTFSSTKDNQWGQDTSFASRQASPQNNFDIEEGEYGRSIFDFPHRITLAPIVRIPGPGEDRPLAHAIFGGWSASAAVQLASGGPLNVVASDGRSNANLGLLGARQRPNLVGDPNTSGSDLDRVASAGQGSARWFDASAFADAGPGQFGNSPRSNGDARYQFRKNVDFVLTKDTPVGAGAIAQVRFEILNLTNTPKFRGISSTSFNSSTFGRVNQQVGFMRIWQISFRLTY